MLDITSLSESPKHWESIVDIFFESSSKKEFSSQNERNDFIYKYLGIYKDKYPSLFLIALSEGRVLGYICGSHNSKTDSELYSSLPHFALFEDLYEAYPAHLHINLAQDSRGLGVGSKLIEAFESLCPQIGVHLITGPNARNRSFYQKNKYSFECVREFNGIELLFLGKSL